MEKVSRLSQLVSIKDRKLAYQARRRSLAQQRPTTSGQSHSQPGGPKLHGGAVKRLDPELRVSNPASLNELAGNQSPLIARDIRVIGLIRGAVELEEVQLRAVHARVNRTRLNGVDAER